MSYEISSENLQEICNVKLTSFYEGVMQVLEELRVERKESSNPLDLYDGLDSHFYELFVKLRDHSVEESMKKAKQGAVHEER